MTDAWRRLLEKTGLRYEWRDIVPGAQTERRGGAGPVRCLLGGKDLTGRLRRRQRSALAAIQRTRTAHQSVRAQHFAPRGRHRGPPGGAAHTRGQRADAAVDQADQDAAG